MSVHADPSFAPRRATRLPRLATRLPRLPRLATRLTLSRPLYSHRASCSTPFRRLFHPSHLRREQVAIEVYHSKVPVNKSSTDLLAITASTLTARMTARGMALLTDYAIGFSFIYDEQGVLKVRMRPPRDGHCCDVGQRVLTCMQPF